MNRIRSFLRIVLFLIILLLMPPAFSAAAECEPSAQDYLDESPVSLSDFIQNPLGSFQDFIEENVLSPVTESVKTYRSTMLFLLLCAVVVMLVPEESFRSLLEMIAAGGCFLLLSGNLLVLIEDTAAKSIEWRDLLTGFVPVFAAVTASGGQITSATVYSGFFLMSVSMLAEMMRSLLLPAAKLYLAASAAGIFTGSKTFSNVCAGAGKVLRRITAVVGMLFSGIMAFQRVFASAADNAAMKAGKAVISGAVPIVGQALTGAADAVLSGVHTLQAGLGFAVLVILAASFVPLYLKVCAGWLFSSFCAVAARTFGLEKTAGLFACLSVGLETITAVLALFFGMTAVSTLLMVAVGNGG